MVLFAVRLWLSDCYVGQPELCVHEARVRKTLSEVRLVEDKTQRDKEMQIVQQKMQQNKHVEYGMRVDTYAFGVMLYEMLVHQPPWKDIHHS